MNILYSLIIIPLVANYVCDWSGLIDKIKYKLFYLRYTRITEYQHYSLRPLDCCKCFSVHLSWIYFLITDGRLSLQTILLSLTSGAIAFIINRIINRI